MPSLLGTVPPGLPLLAARLAMALCVGTFLSLSFRIWKFAVDASSLVLRPRAMIVSRTSSDGAR